MSRKEKAAWGLVLSVVSGIYWGSWNASPMGGGWQLSSFAIPDT